MMKLTEWYPADIKPVRKGVYNVLDYDNENSSWYSYWDGVKFNYYSYKVDRAFKYRFDVGCGSKTVKWRGISRD